MNGFVTLLKREYWEHRGGFVWAPVWTAISVITLSVLGLLWGVWHTSGRFNGEVHIGIPLKQLLKKVPPEEMVKATLGYDIGMSGLWMLIQVVLFFVLFFYLIGALYDDRKDRSVLFWKSLPISNTATVLSKVLMAALGAPLVAFAVTVAMHIVFLLVLTVSALLLDLSPMNIVWGPAEPLRLWSKLFLMVPINALWSLPAVGWLLLASSYARSKPFLWAIALPVAVGVMISWFDVMRAFKLPDVWYVQHVLGRIIGGLVPGSWVWATNLDKVIRFDDNGPVELIRWDVMARIITSPDMWIGVVAGAAMIAGAVYFRRKRELAD